MKVKDIDALREQISKDPREAFTKHQVWLFASEHNKTVPTVEAIPKDQYEARLKADMVAMLKELSMKIGEIEDGYTEFDEESKRSLTMIPLESVERLIDGKINSLKEKSNEL